ncbi:hypothetical protein [Sphingomonas xinjiangensis]|uniref:Uncharacterized protein n=1 Tax=Sphingomonas xinjiangensis TaxID=643568 RepID=A0A840YMF6_9SPHN|nr:hypothetical protein [Sphingomonas xinjiangensis]MBB5711006.1 hypothetical protein [Sphingomonas xinjiangensis]
MAKKLYLTATMAGGYVKTIGPTAAPFTDYWRLVARLRTGNTEVFWGHINSIRAATGKKAALGKYAAARASRMLLALSTKSAMVSHHQRIQRVTSVYHPARLTRRICMPASFLTRARVAQTLEAGA